MFLRPHIINFSVIPQHLMEVYLYAPVVWEKVRKSEDPVPAVTRGNPARLPAVSKTLVIQPKIPIFTTNTQTDVRSFDFQHMLESAKNIARDDARKTEQSNLIQEKLKLNTPAGSLSKDLKNPYEEIHLANGILKIITSAGEICFHPVPYFARDNPDIFRIPTNCPK